MKSLRLFAWALFVVMLATAGSAVAQTVEQGFTYLANMQTDKARAFFSQQQNPYYKGVFYLAIGQPDSAKAVFDAAHTANAKDALAITGLGEVALAQKNTAEAETQFKAALKVSKNKNAEVFFRIGEAYRRAGNNAQAVSYYEKAVGIENDNPWYYVTMGNTYLDMNEGPKATQNYERAKYFDKNYAPAYLAAGQLFERARDYNQALAQYNEGAAVAPNYAPVYKALGEVYYLARQYDKAAENYQKYVDLSGGTPDDIFNVAAYQHLAEQYEASNVTLAKLPANYENPIRYRLLGYNNNALKNYAAGVEPMAKFMTTAPADYITTRDHSEYGWLLISSGKDTLAGIAELKTVAMSDSSQVDLFRTISSLLFNARKYAEAAQVLEEGAANGMTLAGTDYLNMGKAYYFAQDFPKSDSAFAFVNQVATQSSAGWLWRARAQGRMDPDQKLGTAVEAYQKYIELTTDPASDKANYVGANSYLLSYYYQKFDRDGLQEDQDAAIKAADTILSLDPENVGANQVKEFYASLKK